MKKTLLLFLFALFFIACGDSATPKNNSKVGESSSEFSSYSAKSSSSEVVPISSSVNVVSPADVIVGSMKDSRDGQTNKTVKIGTQTWMAQNLNYKTEYSHCYKYTASNCAKYGRLYRWAAAMDSAGSWSTTGKGCGYGKTCSPIGPVRGVCPEGWHLPTKTEWEILFDAVGGKSIAGMVLKSTFGWYNCGNCMDDFSFSALPAGMEHDKGDAQEGFLAHFWSSTESKMYGHKAYGSYEVYGMNLIAVDSIAYLDFYDKKHWVSVRCLKD